MSNFEYIVSGLPVLTSDYKYAPGESFRDTVEEIRNLLSAKDAATLDFLLKGFDSESLNEDFYASALSSANQFIREYFRFDLNLRNAKVRYINRQLGRPEDMDVITGKGAEDAPGLDADGYRFTGGEFEEADKVASVLALTDLLSREKGLDDIFWDKIDALQVFHYFDLTSVLCFVAKLHIVDRWLTLDYEKGKQMFRKLTDEVRGTFKSVNYTE